MWLYSSFQIDIKVVSTLLFCHRVMWAIPICVAITIYIIIIIINIIVVVVTIINSKADLVSY